MTAHLSYLLNTFARDYGYAFLKLFGTKPLKTIKRICLVTDAWTPQINGVVTTLSQLVKYLTEQGIEIDIIQPYEYPRIPLPTYPDIPLVWRAKGLEDRILKNKPDAIHIATEGSLGWRARRIALKHKLPFTTAYHTKYPEYLAKRLPIPASWVYKFLTKFHDPAQATFVPAQAILNELESHGFQHLVLMGRGVDKRVFNPQQHIDLPYKKPIYLYVGRLAVEKNIQAFLSLDLEGTKLMVGDGPQKEFLEKHYPDAVFVGSKQNESLAQFYASADVMVFSSLTDTFGLVNIEAMACGTPVAAFPVTGPIDIITPGLNGALNPDLNLAIQQALSLPRPPIAQSVENYDWQVVASDFLQHLAQINWSDRT
ncbi:MAG: glycosyltransferase family 1 protein [Methyloprofundus sp.]|nr:glycosyltransferase family 1 protein [Methyloprofundus sp.]